MIQDSEYQTLYGFLKECIPSWLTIESRNFCSISNSGFNLNRKDGGLESIVAVSGLPKIKVFFVSPVGPVTLSVEDPDFKSKFKKAVETYARP